VNGVAAKIAEEVGMLLENAYATAGAGEKQPGHHSGGAAADDDQVVSHVWLARLRSLKSR